LSASIHSAAAVTGNQTMYKVIACTLAATNLGKKKSFHISFVCAAAFFL
jgi:hypothetical protein